MNLFKAIEATRVLRLLGAIALLLVFPAHAEMLPYRPSPAEEAALPEFCKARDLDMHSPEFRQWRDRLGQKFYGISHYCAGLNYINRYFTTSNSRERNFYLSRAVPEIGYLMKDMPDSFPLAGEMYLNRGYAYQLMGNKVAAAADFTRATRLSPAQPQAYLRLIDYYVEAKDRSKALEVASNGLAHVPGNKTLQRKYLELGGKEPFPKPVDEDGAVVSKETSPTQTDKATVVDSDGKPPLTVAPGEMPKSAKETGGNDAKPGDVDSNMPKTAPIGVPGNPYCRFCP